MVIFTSFLFGSKINQSFQDIDLRFWILKMGNRLQLKRKQWKMTMNYSPQKGHQIYVMTKKAHLKQS